MTVATLKEIYTLHDGMIQEFSVACREGCAHCCTCNVVMTGLEARSILEALNRSERQVMMDQIRHNMPENLYTPKLTLNGYVRACMEQREVAEEENDPSWGRCPLLADDRCSIYDIRPFGCRVMLSEIHCGKTGYARVPPLALTVNNLFLQYIEHLDSGGISGNLSDILPLLAAVRNRRLSGNDLKTSEPVAKGLARGRLIENHPVPVLMVPPEHRNRMRPVMERLGRILA